MNRTLLKIILPVTGLYLGLNMLISCGGTNIDDNSKIVFPDSNVSYVSQVQPLMKTTCAISGCHNRWDNAGGIQLDEYIPTIIAEGSTMVIPKSPDKSVLIQMVEEKLQHYPVIYINFNDNHKKGLRTWISEGAKNN